MSPDDFLAWEREQQERHVYLRGEVFAMAGGSARHSALGGRIIALLGSKLGARCETHTADLRLGLDDRHFVYADAVVVCGPHRFRAGTNDVLTNPTTVVEVLSKSTESYDRGEKQAGYLALPSVQHYVLVSQREKRVEVYTREDDGSFRYRVHADADEIRLDRLEATVSVDALYQGVFQLPGDELRPPVSTLGPSCSSEAMLGQGSRSGTEARVSLFTRPRRA
jgi:Uma2 family endonuclease